MTAERVHTSVAVADRITLTRITLVELRKMLDTRSGFWLTASIAITALLATAGVIVFSPDVQIAYSTFAGAIRLPVVIILPLVSLLVVTSEWTQRTGLTTFTLIPHRSRVITGKAAAAVTVGIVAMVVTFGIGALGNLLAAGVSGNDIVWDVSVAQALHYVLGMVLSLLVGFMFGVLIRASTGAIVAYFVYSLLLPGLLGWLAVSQQWFADLQPWVDFAFAVTVLFSFGPAVTAEQWAHIGVTGAVWLVVPLLVGLRFVLRAEVK
jgi:ABC-type transport system involved in multi-copper enzyme maturation permease subunit